MGETEVIGALTEIAEVRIVGAFCLLSFAINIVLWYAYREEIKDGKATTKNVIELAINLTKVVEDTFEIVKELPKEVKDRIKPDLDSINKAIEQLYNRLIR
jgi:hypothetical protein